MLYISKNQKIINTKKGTALLMAIPFHVNFAILYGITYQFIIQVLSVKIDIVLSYFQLFFISKKFQKPIRHKLKQLRLFC
jgi:hypothetical protein